MKTIKNILVALLAIVAMGCNKDNNGGNNPENIYKLEWVNKIPEGNWIKAAGSKFFDGIYISDTLRVKTIPEGGKVSWEIEGIEGQPPTMSFVTNKNGFNVPNAMKPLFPLNQLEGEGNTSCKWRVTATINGGTKYEEKLVLEYFSLPTVRGIQFIYKEGENPVTDRTYDSVPIELKIGEIINVYTGRVPNNHTGQQYKSGWDFYKQATIASTNGIYEIIMPIPANKGQVKGIGVGEMWSPEVGRRIIVTK